MSKVEKIHFKVEILYGSSKVESFHNLEKSLFFPDFPSCLEAFIPGTKQGKMSLSADGTTALIIEVFEAPEEAPMVARDLSCSH